MKNITPHNQKPSCREGPDGLSRALKVVFDQDLPSLLKLAKGKGLTSEAAEDIVFDSFFSLRKKIRDETWDCHCEGNSCETHNMSKYLSTTVSHRARGFYLSRNEKGKVSIDSDKFENYFDLIQAEPSTEDLFTDEIEALAEQQIIIDIMIEGIKDLSAEHREVLIQQYLSDETLEKFSIRVKKNISNIYVIRKRAKKALAKIVKLEMKNKKVNHIRFNPSSE